MANLFNSVLLSALSGSSTPARATIGGLAVDVVEAHELKMDSEVTENPAEDGFPIADHVNRKPLTLTVDVVFTDTPVTWSSGLGVSTVLTYVNSKKGGRMSAVKNMLYQIYKAGNPVTVTLADAIYKNMVMTSAPLPRNVQNGICYKMQLSFTQVRIVSQKTATVGSDAAEMSGATEMDGGIASQSDIGIGSVADTKTIGIDTTGVDLSSAGSLSMGSEVTAATAVAALVKSIVP